MCVFVCVCVCVCVRCGGKGANFKSATISAVRLAVPPRKPVMVAALRLPAVDSQTCSKSAKQRQGKLCIYQVPRCCQHKVKPGLSSWQASEGVSSPGWSTSRCGCCCCYYCGCYGCTSSIFLDSRTRWDCISSVYRTCCHFLE